MRLGQNAEHLHDKEGGVYGYQCDNYALVIRRVGTWAALFACTDESEHGSKPTVMSRHV